MFLTILKNDGVRHWEGWQPMYEMENKSHGWNHQPGIPSGKRSHNYRKSPCYSWEKIHYFMEHVWKQQKIGYIPNYSHLIGIMISKTIGFRVHYSQTHPFESTTQPSFPRPCSWREWRAPGQGGPDSPQRSWRHGRPPVGPSWSQKLRAPSDF